MDDNIIMMLVGAAALMVVTLPGHLVVYMIRLAKARSNPDRTKPNRTSLIDHFIFTVIILILAAIAIPNFYRYNAHPKQSEAKTNLGAIYVAQLSYFSNTNTYAGGPDAFKLINWEPAGQNRYAYFCGDQEIENKLPGNGVGILSLQQIESKVSVRPQSSKTGFTCMAVGNLDNDEMLDVWSINDTKILVNEQDDV